ncbi:MAG: threonine synthase [Clostridiales bacterium]|uniref:threonine synthase n=1 Tax=Clostridium sp. N3C TaxID=1776758 RepID=UPI00092E129A|nr:threonine synthase [Clostridium sp. N3C]NLZ48999.1 threonine synthase [Clostridiales bacterium]SCN23280.1 Threonine synthase [Clostridium sp. N3C]
MSVLYKSTRGNGELISSSQAIIAGIAMDGGLYVPNAIPTLSVDLSSMINMSYKEVAYTVMKEFFTDFTEEELMNCVNKAYDKKFDHEDIAPLRKAGGAYFLELFHGPTIAFKDMALSILPHLLTTSLKKHNINKEVVILTATSGDTGKAALEGFSNVEGIKIIVFFPEKGVSQIQKLQMTTHESSNSYVIGIEGNFDDAQNGVKAIFNDEKFKKAMEENNSMFSSANSINIGRLVPQVAYYFYGYLTLVRKGDIALGDKINIVVPTGNFGNILAAYLAKKMGLPINKLICASNENKVLYDFIKTGIYDKRREFVLTSSPSMDILISSNLERLLYFISGEDSNKVTALMKGLATEGYYEIDDDMKAGLKDFFGAYASEEDTFEAIREVFNKDHYLIDTHTAVAYTAYKKYIEETKDNTPTVIASTASPYKFNSAVMGAVDEKYKEIDEISLINEMCKLSGVEIPRAVKDIEKRPILHKKVCSKDEMKQVVKEILSIN